MTSAPVNPATTPAGSKTLRVTTIVFAALAAIGLVVTLILLGVTLASNGTEDFGWLFAFSVIASIVNVVPALVALILGLVGRRTGGRVALAGIVVGAAVLVVLVIQFIVLVA